MFFHRVRRKSRPARAGSLEGVNGMAGVKGMKQRPDIERSEKQRERAAANLARENELKRVLAKDAKRRERQKELDTIRDQYVQDKVAQALEAKNAPKDPENS